LNYFLEDGLEVHGFPDWAGFDVLGGEGGTDGFSIAAEFSRSMVMAVSQWVGVL
jgi:hypothetical protein